MIILSLDVSSASTGWCIISNDLVEWGTITTSPKQCRADRLTKFRDSLIQILNSQPITHIVMEDLFLGHNVKTLRILSEFFGVAEQTCYEYAEIEPYVISNKTVKSFFKVKTKEELFNFLVDILEFDKNILTFKKNNDIIDSRAQLMCYSDIILKVFKFRDEKEYGFIYYGGSE